jgi:hypothetical protein
MPQQAFARKSAELSQREGGNDVEKAGLGLTGEKSPKGSLPAVRR